MILRNFSERYYFVIKFLPVAADQGLLAGRCISILHGYLCAHPNISIGVAFPEWSDNAIGASIAFVSTSQEGLLHFCRRGYFQEMSSHKLFELSSVLVVPDRCKHVRFLRNQSLAKLFAGTYRRRLHRLKRRAAARGEQFEPVASVINREVGHFHPIFIQNSRGQCYCLHVQKRGGMVDVFGGSYNTYGLATNEIHTGTVPELNELITTLF